MRTERITTPIASVIQHAIPQGGVIHPPSACRSFGNGARLLDVGQVAGDVAGLWPVAVLRRPARLPAGEPSEHIQRLAAAGAEVAQSRAHAAWAREPPRALVTLYPIG